MANPETILTYPQKSIYHKFLESPSWNLLTDFCFQLKQNTKPSIVVTDRTILFQHFIYGILWWTLETVSLSYPLQILKLGLTRLVLSI